MAKITNLHIYQSIKAGGKREGLRTEIGNYPTLTQGLRRLGYACKQIKRTNKYIYFNVL